MKIIKNILITLAAATAFGLFGFTALFFLRDWEEGPVTAEDRASTGQSYASLSAGVTEYQIAGPDSGQVVLLLSGASVPYYIWDGTFENLADAGFKVVRYNYYGRGFSDRPKVPYDRELYERQILDLLDELEIGQPIDLVGLSMGGWVASSFAATYPEKVRRIVFVDPAFGTYPSPSAPEWLARLQFVLGGQDDAADGQLTDFLHPENFPDWVSRYKIQMRFDGFRYGRVSTFYHFGPTDHPENYRRISETDISTMLIWGRQDRTLSFRGSQAVLDVLDSRFLPVDSAGHLPHLEKPEIVNPAIIAFLSEAHAESN